MENKEEVQQTQAAQSTALPTIHHAKPNVRSSAHSRRDGCSKLLYSCCHCCLLCCSFAFWCEAGLRCSCVFGS
eukprot:1490482-Amphidinium_carterae.1